MFCTLLLGGKTIKFEKIRDIVAEKMDIDAAEITLDSSFESMQIDSLDMVEIVMDIEEEFDISIDNVEGLKTIGDLVDYIENK